MELRPADPAGEAPAGPAPRSLLPPSIALGLGIGIGALQHAELLLAAAAAAELHIGIVVCVVLSVAALFNWAVLKLNFQVARWPGGAGGPTLLVRPTATAAGAAPAPTAASASRSRLALFMGFLCLLAMGVALHVEPLISAAGEYQIHRTVVVCAVLSIAALFNWAVLKLNFLVARRPAAAGPTPLPHPAATAGEPAIPAASASRSPVALFVGLCLLMSTALHAKQLAAAAAEYQIDPAVVVGVMLAASALFHLAVFSIHKSLARHQAGAGDEPKKLRRPRGRVPLLPFVVLALVVPTVVSAEAVRAAGAIDLPKEASVWALLALAVSFNIAIGSLYCFVIAGSPPPAATGVRSWSKAAGAMVSCIIAAGVLVSSMLPASGGASGAIAARS
ncbi:unnamed protein product [Urochloa humidicola]